MRIEDKISKYLNENDTTSKLENWIRDSLSGTPRRTNADLMWGVCKKKFRNIDSDEFYEVWDSLVDDGYLVKVSGGLYKWEM